MITAQQMRWAGAHDWYQGADYIGVNQYKIYVYPDGVSKQRIFTDFEELKAWAGY